MTDNKSSAQTDLRQKRAKYAFDILIAMIESNGKSVFDHAVELSNSDGDPRIASKALVNFAWQLTDAFVDKESSGD